MSKILITGSSGFIGLALNHVLAYNNEPNKPMTLINTYRHVKPIITDNNTFVVGDIDAQTQWQSALKGVDCVIHLAARVHVMQETETDPLTAFRVVNTQGTLNLAKQAVTQGVKRFIYLSTIKVNGEHTDQYAFTADDQPNPHDAYAMSKFEAEQQLLALGRDTGLEVVIIRPPLVYGSQVKGNFARLIHLVNKSLPLPLAKINNARSLVSIDNLCALIQLLITHPKAVGEVFLVSDGDDLSTSELFELLAQALGKKSRLFYLPPRLLKLVTTVLGRKMDYDRLFGSLQLDIRKNKDLLDWQPKISVQTGLLNAVTNKIN
ncbi:MAG: SDR family oxidoreductase [Gammaproteobacteria bacterium]|nr:SDR family oxidoreductase [Gammaproteobacteria bacterium]